MRLVLVNAALCAFAGCASAPPPNQQLGAARAMVAQAQPLASEAPMEFATAQNKLARAEQAMKAGDYANARIYAEQAEVDARYALTLAENARAQRAVAELNQGISTLRQELERRVE